MAQETANPLPDTNDPLSNAVVRPEASLFIRQILQTALGSVSGQPTWVSEAKALLANVLMNDVLNGWNVSDPVDLRKVEGYLNDVLTQPLPPAPDPVVALASHAQGLFYRSQRTPQSQQLALEAFKKAVSYDDGFARAHAQLGNQLVLLGQEKSSHPHFSDARDRNPHHPARGYFDWGEGRAFFQEAALLKDSGGTPDWTQAINCLNTSVSELPTVWYNRLYLACAQATAGQTSQSQSTLNDFNNEFKNMLQQLAASQTPPNAASDPPSVFAARTLFYNWLQQVASSALSP